MHSPDLEQGAQLRKPLKISELMEGVTFDLAEKAENDAFEECDGLFWDEEDPRLNLYKNPSETSFAELREEMTEIADGVYKKILQKPAEDATEVDFSRHRITYHRNMYIEGEERPFDSTHLNSKTGEIWMNTENHLLGIVEAIGSMKLGEQSLFLISYKKMFKESGCPPRIPEKADILCDFKILKLEETGDPEVVKQFLQEKIDGTVKFATIKDCIEETRMRATDFFSQRKYDTAIRLYQRIFQTLNFAQTATDDEEAMRVDIISRTLLNLAVCFNKKEDFQNALERIQELEAIKSIDDDPKALYNKGKALMMLNDFDKAQVTLRKALMLRPLDKDISIALDDLTKRTKKYGHFCKSFYKNLKFA